MPGSDQPCAAFGCIRAACTALGAPSTRQVCSATISKQDPGTRGGNQKNNEYEAGGGGGGRWQLCMALLAGHAAPASPFPHGCCRCRLCDGYVPGAQPAWLLPLQALAALPPVGIRARCAPLPPPPAPPPPGQPGPAPAPSPRVRCPAEGPRGSRSSSSRSLRTCMGMPSSLSSPLTTVSLPPTPRKPLGNRSLPHTHQACMQCNAPTANCGCRRPPPRPLTPAPTAPPHPHPFLCGATASPPRARRTHRACGSSRCDRGQRSCRWGRSAKVGGGGMVVVVVQGGGQKIGRWGQSAGAGWGVGCVGVCGWWWGGQGRGQTEEQHPPKPTSSSAPPHTHLRNEQ